MKRTMTIKTRRSLKPKMKLKLKIVIAAASFLFISVAIGALFVFNIGDVRNAFGANYSSTQSGNWNDAATWGGAGIPSSLDRATIGHTVTITANTDADRITVNSGGELKGDGGAYTLTVDGGSGDDFVINGTFNANGSTLKFTRNSQVDGTGTMNFYKIDLNTKIITFKNSCTGTINLLGFPDPFLNAGKIIPGTGSTITYNGSAAQEINAAVNIEFNNLVINNSSGVTLLKNLTISNLLGNLNIQSGTLSCNGYSITGKSTKTFVIAVGAGIAISGTAQSPSGFGTRSYHSASTITFTGNTQSIYSDTYGNVVIAGAGIKSLEGNISVQTITVSSGFLDLAGNTITVENSSPLAIARTAGGMVRFHS